MNIHSAYRSLFAHCSAIAILFFGCDTAVELPLTNPHDPESNNYIPAAPAYLAGVVEGDTAVNLHWTDYSAGEDGFAIEQWIGTDGDFHTIATVPANTTSYRDLRPLGNNVEYNYRVTAFREDRKSDPTNIASIKFTMSVPNKAFLTFVSKTSCSVSLSYNGFFRLFRLERSVNGGQFQPLVTIEKNTTVYLDQNIDTTKTYSYRYTVTTGLNESVFSDPVSMDYSFYDAEVFRTLDLGTSVHSVSFSPDGNKITAAGASNAVKIWEVNSGTVLRDFSYTGTPLAGYSWPYQSTFSSDGSLLAAHCETQAAKGIRIWNAATGAVVKSLSVSGRSFAFSADKKELYVGGLTGGVTIWNIEYDTSVFVWTAHGGNNAVNFVHTLNNGTQLITGSYGGTVENIRTWILNTVTIQKSFSGYNHEFYSISADETKVSAGPYVRDLSSGSLIRTFSTAIIGQTCFNHNGTQVFEKKQEGTITVYSIASGQPVWTKTLTRANAFTYPALASSPTAPVFATASSVANKIDLWIMRSAWRSF